jgi:hypothetical protein
MSEYKRLFRDLQYEIWKVAFLSSFLNAAIAFFVSNIVFTFIKVSYLYSVVPAVIVFTWSFTRKVRKYTLRKIEEGNPEVAEILRTAHDNSHGDNLMVHALFLELMQKMETVTAGVFINPQRMVGKFFIIGVLAFIPILITSFMPFLIIENPLADFDQAVRGSFEESPLAPILPIEDAGERDIYGDEDVLSLGNEKLDITAGSGAGGVDFTNPEAAGGNNFKYNDYPVAVEGEQTTAGTGGRESEGDLINDYSCKTKGTCS